MSHHEDQPEFAYGRPRRQRRLLVILMWAGPLVSQLGINLVAPLSNVMGSSSITFGLTAVGFLMSFTAFYFLSHLMKGISERPVEGLDERQALVSGRAYRQAFHIIVFGGMLAYSAYAFGWLRWFDLSYVGIWILLFIRSLPMSIMAWNEPD